MKLLHHCLKTRLLKSRINTTVKFCHVQSIVICRNICIVRDVEKMLFDPFIFKNRFFIHQHLSSVLTDNPGHDTKQSTFSRTVGTDQSKNLPFPDIHGDLIYCLYLTKSFAAVFYLNHRFPPYSMSRSHQSFLPPLLPEPFPFL